MTRLERACERAKRTEERLKEHSKRTNALVRLGWKREHASELAYMELVEAKKRRGGR